MNGVGGVAGWRWIFILEGILTVVVAVIAFFTIYDFPDTASFLTPEERAWVVHRLKYQGSEKAGQMVAETERFKWRYVIAAFTDWQIYLALFSKCSETLRAECKEFQLKGDSVLGHRLPTLRYQLLPPDHYHRTRLYVLYRPALDNVRDPDLSFNGVFANSISPQFQTDIYHRRRAFNHRRLVLRSPRHALSLHPWLYVCRGQWVHHCHRGLWPQGAWTGVCRYLHRSLRYLSGLPGQRHLAVEQPFRLLQKSGGHGYSHRGRKSGRWYVLQPEAVNVQDC